MAVGGQRHAPAALPAGKRPGTKCPGGWVGPMVGLGGCPSIHPSIDGATASLKGRFHSPVSSACLLHPRIPTICNASLWTSGRQPVVRGPLMVSEKILLVRREIWTLFAIFIFIILFHYILIRLRVTDTWSLTIFALLRCIKLQKMELLWSLFYRCLYLFKKNLC
jgi:hypothetical protein